MSTAKVLLAKMLAHEAHDSIGQTRKYPPFPPYWIHTDEVAATLEGIGEEEDTICAGHTHDILEDVFIKNPKYSLEYIEKMLGPKVAQLTVELTDVYTSEAYPKWNRKKRKAAERERVLGVSKEAKTIKLADLISNTNSIVKDDKDFAVTYIREKIALLGHLADGNPYLLAIASQQALDAAKALNIKILSVSGK